MLVKHPILLGGVRQCLISVGLCWMLECSNESNTIQQRADFSTRHKIMVYFLSQKHKRWTMLDEKFELSQTSSNIVKHGHPTLYI